MTWKGRRERGVLCQLGTRVNSSDSATHADDQSSCNTARHVVCNALQVYGQTASSPADDLVRELRSIFSL